jgi:hypothetical protein
MSTRALDYFAGRPDRVAALRAAIMEWRGTPFRKHSHAKGPGGGVDCEWFIPSCLRDSGAITAAEFADFDPPDYAINHAEHSDESHFLEWFRQPIARRRVRPLDEDEQHVDGDFVFPNVGRCLHHIGFRVGVEVFHIVRPSGWASQTISMLKLHRSRYRLTEAAS